MTEKKLDLADIEETVMAMPTPGSVFSRDENGEFVLVAINRPAIELFQAVRADPTGRKMSEFSFSPNAAATVTGMANECVRVKATQVFESPFVLRDGSTVHVSVTMVPIVEGDEVRSIVTTADDITELVALRMQRARELSLFASGFVHTCAWCGRVQDGETWKSAADYVADHHVRPRRSRCPDCAGS